MIGGIILAGLAVVLHMTLVGSLKMADAADLNIQIQRLERLFEADVKYASKIKSQDIDSLSLEVDHPIQGSYLVYYFYDPDSNVLTRDDGSGDAIVARYVEHLWFEYKTKSGGKSNKVIDTYLVSLNCKFIKASVPSHQVDSNLKMTYQFRNL